MIRTYHRICKEIAQRACILRLPVLTTVTVSFMRVEVLRQMPKNNGLEMADGNAVLYAKEDTGSDIDTD
jgi:hypothetical protein